MTIPGTYQQHRRRAFQWALVVSCAVNFGLVAAVNHGFGISGQRAGTRFEFVRYEFRGGSPGGADNDESVETSGSPENRDTVSPSPTEGAVLSNLPKVNRPQPPDDTPADEPVEEAETAESMPTPQIGMPAAPSDSRSVSPQAVVTPQPSAVETAGGGGPGGGRGGPGVEGGAGNPDLLGSYAGTVQRRLEAFKLYPENALRNGVQGMARIAFVVNENGTVRNIRMIAGSGDADLDAEALALPKRAEPFPPIPSALRRVSLGMEVPIEFAVVRHP